MSKRSSVPRGFFPGRTTSSNLIPLRNPPASAVPLSPGLRLRELISRPDARTLIRRSSPQDLFLLVKQVGFSDALELLELASVEQVQKMMDLDVWSHDSIRPEVYADWLDALLEARADLGPLVEELDPEALVWFLQQHVRVHLQEEDMPEADRLALEALNGVSTPDRQYLLEFLSDADTQELISRLIRRLYDFNLRTAHWLLEAIRWELPAPLLENAYRIRTGRVEELGFCGIEEALQLYRPLRGMTSPPPESLPFPRSGPLRDVPLPLGYTQFGGELLLGRAMTRLLELDPERELTHPLLLLINRIVVAERQNPGELEALKQAAQQAQAHVNLGLELESGGELESAVGVLRSTSLPWLFRRGYSRVLVLQQRAQELERRRMPQFRELPGPHADAPWREVVSGLQERHPRRFLGLEDPCSSDFAWFATRAHVEKTDAALRALETIHAFVFDELAPAPVDRAVLERALTGMDLALTPLGVFTTSLANRWLDRPFAPDPLDGEALRQVLVHLFVEGGAAGELRPIRHERLEEVQAAVAAGAERRSPEQQAIVHRFVREALERLREAYGALELDTSIELTFVGGPLYLRH